MTPWSRWRLIAAGAADATVRSRLSTTAGYRVVWQVASPTCTVTVVPDALAGALK